MTALEDQLREQVIGAHRVLNLVFVDEASNNLNQQIKKGRKTLMSYWKTRMLISEMRRNFYAGRRPFSRNVDNPGKEREPNQEVGSSRNYCKEERQAGSVATYTIKLEHGFCDSAS